VQAIDPAIGLANRVLEREDWARERLSAHAGRTVRMICGPMASTLAIAPSGMLFPAHDTADLTPSLTLSVSPLRIPTLLAHPERWHELVAADGDAELAATLADLAQTFPWFVEQAFASALGPLIGTRVADAGRALLSLPEHMARSVGSSVTSYARDESGLGVGAAAAAEFSAEVAAIAARVDALAQRLDRVADAGSAKAAPSTKSRI
jgi:ubiquinone biosynthesis protein UbiJ